MKLTNRLLYTKTKNILWKLYVKEKTPYIEHTSIVVKVVSMLSTILVLRKSDQRSASCKK